MDSENLFQKGKNHLKKTLVAGLVSSAIFLSACGGGNSGSPNNNPKPNPQENENTYVLDDTDLNNLQSVSLGLLTFNLPNYDLSPGKIIVSGISPLTPNGLLRKIISTQDNIIFQTTQATLEEALENVSFKSQDPFSQNSAYASSRNYLTISQLSLTPLDFNINLNNIVLWDEDYNLNTTDDQIVLNGNFSFSSDFNLEFDIKNKKLNRFFFESITIENSTLEIIASPINGATIRSVKVADFNNLPSFVLGYTPTFPPIPIIIKPQIEVFAGVFGNVFSQINLSVSQEAILTTGVTYENGEWTPHSSFSKIFDFVPPVSQEPSELFDSRVFAGPKLNFLLYGIAGPSVEIEGSLHFHSGHYQWDLSGGLKAKLGIDTGVFGSLVGDYSATIINYHTPSVSGTITQPQPIDIIIQPGKDASVKWSSFSGSSIPNTNYNTTLLELSENGGERSNSLIQFPLSSIPSRATINSAKLNLHGYCVHGGSLSYLTVIPEKILGNWSESTVTWNNKPNYDSTSYLNTEIPETGSSAWHKLEATALVQQWVDGSPNYGLALILNDSSSQCKFKSKEYSTSSLRPKLEISYTN